MKTNWKVFLVLLVLSIWGIIAIIPYSLTIQGGLPQNLPVPLYLLFSIQIIQNTILFAVVIFIGLLLARKVGLGLPIIEGRLEGREVGEYLRSILGISVGLGIVAAILIIGLDYLFSIAGLTTTIANAYQIYPPPWQGFLSSFYGGINEEVFVKIILHVPAGLDIF